MSVIIEDLEKDKNKNSDNTSQNVIEDDIAIPTPQKAYFGYDIDENKPTVNIIKYLTVGVLLLIVSIFIGVISYKEGVKKGQKSLPPIIMPKQEPILVPMAEDKVKKRPETRNLNIYNMMDGKQTVTKNSKIEKPVTGELETLLSSKNSARKPSVEKIDLKVKATTKITKEKQKLQKNNVPIKPIVVKGAPKVAHYIVQVASFRTSEQARKSYQLLSKKYPKLFSGYGAVVQKKNVVGKGMYFRLGVSGFAKKAEASLFCKTLKQKGHDCLLRTIVQ